MGAALLKAAGPSVARTLAVPDYVGSQILLLNRLKISRVSCGSWYLGKALSKRATYVVTELNKVVTARDDWTLSG